MYTTYPERVRSSAGDAACDCFATGLFGCWHVLHVRSRQEKVIAADLRAMGILHFLPLVAQTRVYGRRRTVIEVPLFPSYLFVRGTLDDVYRCDRTRRVAAIIPVPDQARLEWELRNLHAALDGGAALDPYPFLRDGMRVMVRSGPFRGIAGVIERRGHGDRLILQVETLGRAVSLDLCGAMLEPLGNDVEVGTV